MDTAIRAWLLGQLGAATDVTDLENRYDRLGSARAVAIEVLNGRLADLLAQPTTLNVPGVVGLGYGENIKALERKIAALQAGDIPAPDDPDGSDSSSGIGWIVLQARPRR
ncbi:hypothetical protein OIE75_40800 (plasmid) [Streptomyces sp. NBC_01723]|uniref:hypothetical protein n=1 Tax=Streptomyces sp. NBC_01723 TaxID=2975921 RepID=UPI002E2EC90D|nr:hypothetical protein [Streptomyces sp. NBC_01723]